MRKQIKAMFFLLIPFICYACFSAATKAPKYQPKEVQALRLKVKQDAAQVAQIALQQAQDNFNQKIQDLMDESKKVQQENGWPEATKFDPNNLLFCDQEVINPKTSNLQCPTADVPLVPQAPAPKPEDKKKK